MRQKLEVTTSVGQRIQRKIPEKDDNDSERGTIEIMERIRSRENDRKRG